MLLISLDYLGEGGISPTVISVVDYVSCQLFHLQKRRLYLPAIEMLSSQQIRTADCETASEWSESEISTMVLIRRRVEKIGESG